MLSNDVSQILQVIRRDSAGLLEDWLKELAKPDSRVVRVSASDLRDQSREFLSLTTAALGSGGSDLKASAWTDTRDFLANLSRSSTLAGSTATEVAAYVLSLKRPLFARLKADLSSNAADLAQATWTATDLIDDLALYTTEVFQKSREEVIARQQADMLELSTPVVKLWDGILALPMIGTLDSGRTQVVMESLLQRIVETGAEIAILDITGVPTVDTLVAQHLLKTVTAARLMGADCIISGIRPQIAATIVHLGVELGDVVTKASLVDAFKLALKELNVRMTRVEKTR